MSSLLTLIIGLPLIGSLLCLVVPSYIVKRVALGISLIVYACCVIVYCGLDLSDTTANITSGYLAPIDLAVDGLSVWFILLTGYLTPITLLASYDSVRSHVRGFMIAQLITEGLLLCVFIVTDLVSFYVAYEAVLVPLFITIGV